MSPYLMSCTPPKKKKGKKEQKQISKYVIFPLVHQCLITIVYIKSIFVSFFLNAFIDKTLKPHGKNNNKKKSEMCAE